MRTLDYLPNTDIHLYQDSEMFRINSDTRYLGEFIEVKKSDTILDIGTNNGALLLYGNMKGCKKLIGVDINKEALDLCEENMKLNDVSCYELHHCKVQELEIDKVDVVVCNPPYFKNSLLNDNSDVAKARHEICLSIEEVVLHSKRLLKENGKLMIVYKSSELVNLIKLFDIYGFGIRRLQFVYDCNKDNSTCLLIEGVRNRKHNVKVLNPLYIKH